jgi:hypothetical protein
MGDRGFGLFSFFDPSRCPLYFGRKKTIFFLLRAHALAKILIVHLLHKLYYILKYIFVYIFAKNNI